MNSTMECGKQGRGQDDKKVAARVDRCISAWLRQGETVAPRSSCVGSVAYDRFGFQVFHETKNAILASVTRLLVATERHREVRARVVDIHSACP